VKLEGSGLGNVVLVRLPGRNGPLSATPNFVTDRAVTFSVPAGARSGRPEAEESGGAIAVASERLRIVRRGEVPPPRSFKLRRSSVTPGTAFFDARRQALLRYRFRSDRRIGIRVELRRRSSGHLVRAWVLRDQSPFGSHAVRWNGLTRSGAVAPDGRYRFRVGRRGHRLEAAGSLRYHRHYFPVRGPHWDRGFWGEFGAPRLGDRVHEGFDVMAPCGTPLAAARGGRVKNRGYASLDGNFVVINGRKTGRTYRYSHMREPATVADGARVHTRQRIGEVGATGNAATVGCHLHLEIRIDGRPIDPEPQLKRWDRWS
jgi:murein DD-endopeptidase MepM/ murein hydrolase activator NlpD